MPVANWKYCIACGRYQRTSFQHCLYHAYPVKIVPISKRMERHAQSHANASQCWHLRSVNQDTFVAYALRLEDLTKEYWSDGAISEVRAVIPECELPKFTAFLLEMEKATGRWLDISDMIEQYLAKERTVEKQKIAQN